MTTPKMLKKAPSAAPIGIGVVVFSVLLIVAIVAVVGERVGTEGETTRANGVRQNANLAVAFEQYVIRIMRNAEAVTDLMAQTVKRGAPQTELRRLAIDRAANNDFLDVIALFDERGQLIVSSHQEVLHGVSWALHPDFKAHAAGSGEKPLLGEVMTSSPLLKVPAVPISQRISRADGSFGGISVAFVEPRRFTEFYANAAVFDNDSFVLAGLDGMTRVRQAGQEVRFGDDIGSWALMKQRAQQAQGSYHGPSAESGVMRLNAYRTLKDYPIVVVVGTDDRDLLADYDKRKTLYYTRGVVATLCIVLFALLVMFWLNREARASRALAESEERFRALTELSTDWYWEQDENFRFTMVSDDHRVHNALDVSAYLGKTRWELGSNGVSDAQMAEHRRTVEAHEPFRDFEYWYSDAPGHKVHVAVSGDPVFNAEGVFTGYRGASTDISARKIYEAEILRLNVGLESRVQQRTAELHAFSYSISHDMRAPLRAIDAFSTLLVERYADKIDDEGKGLFARIRANAQRMSDLIDGLLALSVLSTTKIAQQHVNLSVLAHEVIADLRAVEPARAITVLIADNLHATGDKTLLRQVMENLLGNAWKYTRNEAAPHIEVGSLSDPGRSEVWFVRDNGAGFDMQYASKLFQPFERMHSDHEFPGTGIGLALVSRIINRHDGRIWATAALNEGATFFFTLHRPAELQRRSGAAA